MANEIELSEAISEELLTQQTNLLLSLSSIFGDGNFGKETSAKLADALTAPITEGAVDMFFAAAMAKCYAEAFGTLAKRAAEYINNNLKEDSYTANGVEFKRKITGVKYHYDEDPEGIWQEKQAAIAVFAAEQEGREKTLRTLGLVRKEGKETIAMTLK